ncbi:hypothetical protein L6164_028321 [Bauhinia variegata]|uniref:Uncharacterized protein n=1 Tax=Bauhinia variegata TaxID=167791 RepID=A0ACB9LVZ9_BAUVA|nr:hypothetical protein L6164_028321 [Bauhinia variegata]
MKSTKQQDIDRGYRKPTRYGDAVITTMESSIAGEDNSSNSKLVASISHGSISVIGRRRAMEDAVKVVPGFIEAEHNSSWGYDFFAVYDGHVGSTVANACRDSMHLLLSKEVQERLSGEGNSKGLDWHEVMSSCFMKMDQKIGGGDHDETSSESEGNMAGNNMGSTALVVMVGKEEIVVANCGDCRAVLCRDSVAVQLSRDHKPDFPDERERIEAAGGRVINWKGNRVLGVLATSRSIGDHYMKPYVISEPEVKVCGRTESDEFIVIGSDGLWDVVSNNFACEVARRCLDGQMRRNFGGSFIKCYAAEAAALLAELAMARGSKDNISVIVVHLKSSCKDEHVLYERSIPMI